MNELETQLSRLFQAAVGEPPKQVTLQAVRRRLIRRRVVMGATTTAVLAVAAAVGLAVSANAIGTHPAVSHRERAVVPRYYFEGDYNAFRSPQTEYAVRSVATGAVKGKIRCPGSKPAVLAAAAAGDQTFFVSCAMTAKPGTRVYRFVVTRSGRIGALEPVRGGSLVGLRTGNLAATPDGSELAIGTAPLRIGPIINVVVINTVTGAHAIWHGRLLGGGVEFSPLDVSFADHGRELAAFGYTQCASRQAVRPCKAPGEVMVAVNHALRGGRLADGRVVFRQAELVQPRAGWLNSAFIGPGGTTAVAGVIGPAGVVVYRLSAATGRPIRVLFHLDRSSSYRFISPDASGLFLLFSGFTDGPRTGYRYKQLLGWIDHAKLMPLKPATVVMFGVW